VGCAVILILSESLAAWDWTDTEFLQHAQACAKRGPGVCVVFALREDVKIYSAPNPAAKVVATFPHWDGLLLDPSTNVADWVKVRSFPVGPAEKRINIGWAWVRRSDVALYSDYRKVVRCWPIKTVHLAIGDTVNSYSFELSGGVTETLQSGKITKGHVYLAGSLIAIRDVMQGHPMGFWGRYVASRQTIENGDQADITGDEITAVINFKAEELVGCTNFPLLQRNE